ncbi:MAG: Gldg family protein [Pirellulaceae bacterium]|nr:Gldg family protein [Planctomycetales bacterium]
MSLLQFLVMSIFSIMFVVALSMLVVLLGVYRPAMFAVMRRNFVGYFINPTGYVFLALFVVLTSFAAFWPHNFFTANLANFDQLSLYLPYIMLVIIPAITMSAWAEEKRQGTDELLLTLPTTDFEIVLGKYFASVFIFTVALLLSQFWNVFILILLTQGELDVQLQLSTYLGFWFMGVSMLGIGMGASFLTNNLTVGFILGALFNAPLVFLDSIDAAVSETRWSGFLADWSLRERMEPFGRGLISLPSIAYFIGIAAVSLYVCVILIGRRHWLGAKTAWLHSLHYFGRTALIVVSVVSLTFIAENTLLNRLRIDTSEGHLSSLSPRTQGILANLATQQTSDGEAAPPILIEAFVSSDVPSEYAQIRSDLLNLLREFDALGGRRLQVTLHDGVEPFSNEASLAEKRFGIRPRQILSRDRGAIRNQEVIMGAVFTCGLERVVVDFFEYGMPVEYELIRSINTVAQTKRKVLGIVDTDALFMGGRVRLSDGSIQLLGKQLIVADFEKQYTVERINPNDEIQVWVDDPDAEGGRRLRYDAMVLVQPSSLGPIQLDHVIKAIEQGVPTAIFEDPRPETYSGLVPGTVDYATNARIRGEMRSLWNALHITPAARINQFGQRDPFVVWQAYNPYQQIEMLSNSLETVFIRNVMTNLKPENMQEGLTLTGLPQDDVEPDNTVATANLEELVFVSPGAIQQSQGKSDLVFVPLVRTGNAGTVPVTELLMAAQQQRVPNRGQEEDYFILAARIRTNSDESKLENPDAPPMDVVYVADIDCLNTPVLQLTSAAAGESVQFRMQNRIFALNLIDSLLHQTDYIEVRGRRQEHRTLKQIELEIDSEYRRLRELSQSFEKEVADAREAEEKKLTESRLALETQVAALERKRERGEDVDRVELQVKQNLLTQLRAVADQRLSRLQENLRREMQQKVREENNATRLRIQNTQSWYKSIAVGVPWIPLALIGMGVFAYRRLREREGLSKTRLRR